MNDQSFLAAQRAPMLVNRAKELDVIQRAIFQPEASCQIVFIRGKGGMGKSRLAEEVLWRGGNWRIREIKQRGPIPPSHAEWDWGARGAAIVGDLIDMSATHLHGRAPFLRAIRDALIWPGNKVNFTRYDAAYDKFENQRVYMGDYDYIQQLGQEAERQFLVDYRENAKNNRLVLILDTVEKLYPMGGTELLLQEGLLQPEDMAFYTYQWLLKQIREGGLPNTTLLLVGREEEGHLFFGAVNQASNRNPDCKIIPLREIGPFLLEDTKIYFQALAKEWKENANSSAEGESIASAIANIAGDAERMETIWIFTGGQPVRLALYTDLIVEDWTIPDQLQESPDQARKIQASAEELGKAQKEIESGFIRLLFGRPNLRAEILTMLVRAPRGLNTEQLHYALGSDPGETPGAWLKRKQSDSKQRELGEQIASELETLQRLAIVKNRPNQRIGLQDEVYRIYKNALANDERENQAERNARQKLYSKLETWARYFFEKHLKELTETQAYDERQLKFERPSMALEARFPALPQKEQIERVQLRADMQHWELEGLHYALLLNLTYNFNHELFDLADQKWIANDEDADAVIQAELWHLLEDPAYALEEFGTLTGWWSLQRRGEKVLTALKRVAIQNDVSGWIKRFGLRKEYERAIEFAEQVENAILKWAKEKAEDANFLPTSWQHTFANSERALWRNYARIFNSQDMPATIKEMENTIKALEAFQKYRQDELVFPERKEYGFLGHPAEIKIQRVEAIYYNYIGYAYAGQGNTTKAKENYGKALRSMRKTEDLDRQATTRNNLARVLSDRGYARGRRLCLDALELRKRQGAEVPIAYSYNTLALMDNDHMRPDLAWIEAAIAVAYFRKAEDPRGLGLALLQLSEALRRLARMKIEAYHLHGDSVEVVLETAERAINEAVKLFTEGPAARELIRRVEAWIEKGCLERDLIRVSENEEQKERRYRDALYYLELASNLAHEKNNSRLELDALVNMAWTHYHFGKYEQAEEALHTEKLFPKECLFIAGKPLPTPEHEDLYVYQQLSKIYGLRGRMAMDQFGKRIEAIKESEDTKEKRRELTQKDKTVQGYLKDAAEAYVLALAYAQLLSPRSTDLVVIYDALYGYLKGFNLGELGNFHRYESAARKRFQTAKIKLVDLGNLDEFILDSFGSVREGS